jgi:flagellar protein FlbD
MIQVTRLNHAPLVLNSDLIVHIEVTPDTVITLTTGQILRVRESPEEVVRLIVEFRRRISATWNDPTALWSKVEETGSQLAGEPPEEQP